MGCGWRNFGSDWIHIDGGDYDHLDYKDITKLEFEDNTVDLIYASHVIEYFDREEAINLLLEFSPGSIVSIFKVCTLFVKDREGFVKEDKARCFSVPTLKSAKTLL